MGGDSDYLEELWAHCPELRDGIVIHQQLEDLPLSWLADALTRREPRELLEELLMTQSSLALPLALRVGTADQVVVAFAECSQFLQSGLLNGALRVIAECDPLELDALLRALPSGLSRKFVTHLAVHHSLSRLRALAPDEPRPCQEV